MSFPPFNEICSYVTIKRIKRIAAQQTVYAGTIFFLILKYYSSPYRFIWLIIPKMHLSFLL